MGDEQGLLIDVSRLAWRGWSGRLPTGIDRVCLAYLDHYGPRARAVVQWRGQRRVFGASASARLFALFAAGMKVRRRALAAALAAGWASGSARAPRPGMVYLNVGHTGLDDPGLARWIADERLRAVHFVHDLIPITHPQYCRPGEQARHARRMRTVLDSAAGVIGNSQATLDELARFAAGQGRAMPPGVAAPIAGIVPERRAARTGDGPPTFVVLGTIEARKNHALLLDVWERLVADGGPVPRLHVIGQRGWEADEVFRRLDALGSLERHVIERGRCSDAALAEELTAARAVLMPSFIEGFGLPVVEALAGGTPVIAADLGVYRELAGEIPAYRAPDDVAGWAALVRDHAGDGPDRARQLAAIADYRAPGWPEHFDKVDRFLAGLGGAGAAATGDAGDPFLAIPPFPEARPMAPIAEPGGGAGLSSADLDAIAAAKVGGSFWGARPALPDDPFLLDARRGADGRDGAWRWTGRRRAGGGGVDEAQRRFHGCLDPWHLVAGASAVRVDDDGDALAAVAVLSGVDCFIGDALRPCDGEAVRAALARHRFRNPFTGGAWRGDEAIAQLAAWAALIDANRPLVAATGFAAWKRSTVAPLLFGGTAGPRFGGVPRRVAKGAAIAIWKSKAPAGAEQRIKESGARLIEVEDGFIRSTGLGADCVPPLSIVVDGRGIYFDASGPSDLEALLARGGFDAPLLARAAALRQAIVAQGLGKYGADRRPFERPGAGRRVVLVCGQVEDDRSILCSGGAVATNLELLRRARAAEPDAFLIYKPHPDVEAGHRTGAIGERDALALADRIERDAPIASLIDIADGLHVITSLAGFEALLRGKDVTTHGVPFYAGWGLTRDLGDIPARRGAARTLDELVAATLLVYPRYLDPVTGLPCPAELLVARLAAGAAPPVGPLVRLRRLQGRAKRWIASVTGEK